MNKQVIQNVHCAQLDISFNSFASSQRKAITLCCACVSYLVGWILLERVKVKRCMYDSFGDREPPWKINDASWEMNSLLGHELSIGRWKDLLTLRRLRELASNDKRKPKVIIQCINKRPWHNLKEIQILLHSIYTTSTQGGGWRV